MSRDNTRYVLLRITYDDSQPVPQPAVLHDSIVAAMGQGMLTPTGEEIVDEHDLRVSKYKFFKVAE